MNGNCNDDEKYFNLRRMNNEIKINEVKKDIAILNIRLNEFFKTKLIKLIN